MLSRKGLAIFSKFVLPVFIAAAGAIADTPPRSGQWGLRGITKQLIPRDDLVVDIDGRGVSVYDVTDPGAIRQVSAVQTDDATVAGTFLADGRLEVVAGASLLRYDLAADGRLTLLSLVPFPGVNMLTSNGSMLAGAGPDGVTVWQTNGASLGRVAQYLVRGAISAIALHGSILYVAVENVAVFVFDTTAASAEPLATISENALALAFRGDVLWLATGVTGLVAVDVSDPAAPRILSRTGAGAVDLARIAVSGTLVCASELPDTLHVYDAADPQKPTETATIRDAAQVVAASRGKLFLAGAAFDRFGIETETGTPLRVYDESELHAPKLAGVWEDLAGPVRGVATDGTLAYVVDPPRFRIVDVSRSDAPREIASMAIDAGLDRVKLRGSDVILYGRGDVLRIDVHDPYNPKTTGVFHSLGRPPSNAAFARDTIIEGNPWSGLHVVDFDSFAEPGQISGVKGHYYEIVALPDTIYGFELTTMRAIDLANRNNAEPVRDVGIGVIEAAILATQEPPLLVVHAVDRLRIFKLADRLNPIEASSLDVPVDGLLSTDGDAAFFASGGSVFHLDLGDPSHPILEDFPLRAVAPLQIAAARGRVVVADSYSLRIYGPDTAPPPPPSLRVRPARTPR